MKSKLIFVVIGLLSVIVLSVFWSSVGFATGSSLGSGLSFTSKANKATYVLGEPVKIQFEFVNDGKVPKIVPEKGVEVGALRVYISDETDGIYKEYRATGWGRAKGRSKTLLPTESNSYNATLLWNGIPRVSHLNEATAKQVLEGKITTEYVFDKPGFYFIKGVSYVGETTTPIESEPTRIEVREPDGINLTVWNQIKGDREIAFLLQKEAFDTGDFDRKNELITTVGRIISEYPQSIYSSYLRPSLERYNAAEAKRGKLVKP